MSRARTTMSRVVLTDNPLTPGNIILLIPSTTGGVVQWAVMVIDRRSPQEACRVSPADRQKNGARKAFMPHIGRLWGASGWWKQFWRWLFGRKG
jgi:hypothetical protein